MIINKFLAKKLSIFLEIMKKYVNIWTIQRNTKHLEILPLHAPFLPSLAFWKSFSEPIDPHECIKIHAKVKKTSILGADYRKKKNAYYIRWDLGVVY